MKKKYLFSLMLLLSLCFGVNGQNADTTNTKEVYINELYLFDPETNSIKYRKEEPIREYIEVYNNLPYKIRVRELYLTDNPLNLQRWSIYQGKRKYRKIRSKGYMEIYLKGSGKKKTAESFCHPVKDTLYLVRSSGGTIYIVDTICLPTDKKYPIGLYPEKGNISSLDALSPGVANVYNHESQLQELKGLTFQLGRSTTFSNSFENAAHFAPAGAIGYFKMRNYRLYTYERGIRIGVRGYGISYNDIVQSSKAMREIQTKGKQTNYYIDFSYYLNHRLNNYLGFYYGGILSFRFKSVLKYDQTLTTTYFTTGQTTQTTTSYRFGNHNSSIDFLDIVWVTGLRYYYKEAFSISAYFMADFIGFSDNVATTDQLFNGQRNVGFYFSAEVPLWKSRGRIIKSKRLLH